MYKDPGTGIIFGTWSVSASTNASSATQGDYSFGLALPPAATTTDSTEYIGILTCMKLNATFTGWCGVSHGQSGQMTGALLLMAWPYESQVLTSFRFTTGYNVPPVYTGNATLTQLSSTVNATHYQVIYRCQNCLAWNQDGATGSASTSAGFLVLGRAQARKGPTNAGCPSSISFGFHDWGYGQYGAPLDNATNPSYSAWAALPTQAVTTNCASAPTSSVTTSPIATATATTTSSVSSNLTTTTTTATPTATCSSIPKGTTWDYVIIGAGAGGIPMADRLTEAGHTVLLVEKGPASSGRWGGSMKPAWLDGTNLTRFDVPGLCNQIWHDSAGIACTDTDQMAGCVLGGGTAVNAGLWWKPNPKDWDYNFPVGWRSAALAAATNRVFSRIPGTITPSTDGKLYRQEGFNVLAKGLNSSSWKELVPNEHPDQKNHTFGHTSYMFSHGERGGPMATYLVSAAQRRTFTLWMETAVKRIVRTGGHATGVELECNGNGYSGVVPLTPRTGRVIVAAGTFGTPKVLFRSGIGPADQLAIVQSSTDGPTMIANSSWIDLPIGYNLVDHLNTDTIITHPDVVFYDFYEAWDDPNQSDESSYLNNRTGILTQAAPNIGPMMWDEIKGSDGIVRQLQWTSRVEGDSAFTTSDHAMTMSQYLGRGSQSRGRTTITKSLNMVVSTQPFLHNDFDKEAIIKGIENLQATLSNIPNLTWVNPPPGVSAADYVNKLVVTANGRRSNHWMGTAKLGTDDGRIGGTAVVDLNAKVYGTDNIFVVDASIFPGQPTGNPSAMIVIASEQAAQRILALPFPAAGGYGAQCGGPMWAGSFTCRVGLTCRTAIGAAVPRCL
ncbi:Carbohydrate-binding module family 1 protein [Pleurostoma richardsiae]|uniref:Carbohydrate-binding module family 1 protein n=1 Tax=Pleurostoma richardsiae TaxID=41990 RepID=A0AA38RZQ0_9PEZI|nr:Carbohydrate-binding module family 1 protein [Pleurostoma richardsiae]